MGRVVVTGAAGFIGSTLVDQLLAAGRVVHGIDAFIPWYSPARKRDNLRQALRSPLFSLEESDLATAPLDTAMAEADTVFHLAGQPGVQSSWAEGFAAHCQQNVLATQRVLEAGLRAGVRRVVLASSSSVYGDCPTPSAERDLLAPVSPYAVSKVAAENLASVYSVRGLEVVVLRYFTVYGPRQRPDMAIYKMIEAVEHGRPFPVYGTGQQRRSFTFVDDVVEATVRAATADLDGHAVLNVGGNYPERLVDVAGAVEAATGGLLRRQYRDPKLGDPSITAANATVTDCVLRWSPTTQLTEGLARQVAWHRDVRQPAIAAATRS